MHLHLVSMSTETLWNRPEGWRMRTTPPGSWWRDVLARVCWRILDKLRAIEPFQYSEKVYRYGDAEQGSVTELIIKGVDSVLQGRGEVHDYCIVLGAKEFSELVQDMPIHERLVVRAAPIYFRGRNGYRQEFCGLPVHVVPHLSGVAVLPKVIVEERRSAPDQSEPGRALNSAMGSASGQ